MGWMTAVTTPMKPAVKIPRNSQTVPGTSSSSVRMATASPIGGSVTGRMTAGTGLMRGIVEIHIFFPPLLLGPLRVHLITTAVAMGPV